MSVTITLYVVSGECGATLVGIYKYGDYNIYHAACGFETAHTVLVVY